MLVGLFATLLLKGDASTKVKVAKMPQNVNLLDRFKASARVSSYLRGN